MKKVLVIAPTYCRPNCANGQIERHLFPCLPKEEFQVTILCSDRWDHIVETENCKPVRTRFNKWVDYACRFMFHTPFPYIGNTPDKELFCWGNNAVNEALKLAKKEKFDYIHSISMPCSAHVVAYRIKQKLDIPWVAQFFDPWSGNPFRVMRSNRMAQLDKEWEKKVAMSADIVIHPCDAMIHYWAKQYGQQITEKTHILPFATDVPPFVDKKRDESDKIVISHIGSFSSNRNAEVFLKALAKLPQEALNKIQVNFVGNVIERDKALIYELGLSNVVNLVGRVSEDECYKYYEQSDLFLIVDIDCVPNLFYPSKILKYFCYKKPILGITTEQSVIRDELTRTGNYPFGYYDVDGISVFLKSVVDDYNSILTNNKEYGEQFKTCNVIKRYCQILSQLGI